MTSSICLELELITLLATQVVFSRSFAAVLSFRSRQLISFSKFDLSKFSLLSFDEIPHEKADLHGLKVQISLVYVRVLSDNFHTRIRAPYSAPMVVLFCHQTVQVFGISFQRNFLSCLQLPFAF